MNKIAITENMTPEEKANAERHNASLTEQPAPPTRPGTIDTDAKARPDAVRKFTSGIGDGVTPETTDKELILILAKQQVTVSVGPVSPDIPNSYRAVHYTGNDPIEVLTLKSQNLTDALWETYTITHKIKWKIGNPFFPENLKAVIEPA